MRMQDFNKVHSLMDDMNEIDRTLEQLQTHNSGALGVTLNGHYQGYDLLDKVRPVVIKHFQELRDSKLEELKLLGVTP